MKELFINISDLFVSPILKLANGKNGHGERRLYIGDDENINLHICKKPRKIIYSSEFIQNINNILDKSHLFHRINLNRKEIVNDNIKICNNKLVFVVPQNLKNQYFHALIFISFKI